MKHIHRFSIPNMPHITGWAGQQLRANRGLARMAQACLLLMLVWLAGCQPAPQAPLKVGMNAWVGYDPLALARDKGLLDARQVKVIELASSSETLRHFRNGLLDAAALTLDETLRLADEGADIRIVAVLSGSAGADLVLAGTSVARPKDLRGKTIAVERTTVGALMLKRLLEAGQLQQSDVVVSHLEAFQHLAALNSGRVDVAVTYEPLAGAMRDAGYRPIFDSRAMPGDIVDVLVVRAPTVVARPAQVAELVSGWQRGLWTLQEQPEASARLLAPGVNLTADGYLATLKGLRFFTARESVDLLSGDPRRLGQQAESLALTLQSMGVIRATPDWVRLLVADVGERLLMSAEVLP
jgi:NitT/TauT family transport system substrate-binding protein